MLPTGSPLAPEPPRAAPAAPATLTRGFEWRLRCGTPARLRSVRAADADALGALVHRLTPRSRRWRFHAAIKSLPEAMLRQMARPVPVGQVALVACVDAGGDGADGQLVADARCSLNADGRAAEFALMVDDAWQGRGLGRRALAGLMQAAAAAAWPVLCGSVMRDNLAMLGLLQGMGFQRHDDPDDAGLLCLHRPLADFALREAA